MANKQAISPSEKPWERLKGTRMTCDRTSFGWSPDAHDKDRCGAKATWVKRDTCNCGRCDMTKYACDKHHKETE